MMMQLRLSLIHIYNGSGKSTFAKHLNALVMPTEGTVWVDSMDTREAVSYTHLDVYKRQGHKGQKARS